MSGFLVNKSLLDPTVTQYSGGTTSFTLPQSGSTNSTEVFVGGVPQVAGVDFNIAGTALTLTTSAPAGSNMVCARQYFSDGITGTAGANTVATAAIQNDSVTGGKLNPALVAGDIIYADGTDTINRLAKGTALQTLQMNAGATAPNWVTAGAGAMTFISSTDISAAATFAFTAVDASSYDAYLMQLHNLIPATDDVHLWLRTSTDNGSSYDSGGSDYLWFLQSHGSSYVDTSVGQIALTNDGTALYTTAGSAANEDGLSGKVWFHTPHTTKRTMVSYEIVGFVADGTGLATQGFGARLESADVDAWQVLFESGNIESGTINVYGLANS